MQEEMEDWYFGVRRFHPKGVAERRNAVIGSVLQRKKSGNLRGNLYLLNSCDTSLYIIHFIVNFLAVNRKLRLPTSFWKRIKQEIN